MHPAIDLVLPRLLLESLHATHGKGQVHASSGRSVVSHTIVHLLPVALPQSSREAAAERERASQRKRARSRKRGTHVSLVPLPLLPLPQLRDNRIRGVSWILGDNASVLA